MKKIFVVDNQVFKGWNDGYRSVVGIKIENETLYLRNIKGIDITLEGFLTIISEIQDEINEVLQGYKRKNPFKVLYHEGMSGNRSWTMSHLQDRGGFYAEYRKEILYVSCFDKLPNQEIFLPDLALITPELGESTPNRGEITIVEVKPISTEGYTFPEKQGD